MAGTKEPAEEKEPEHEEEREKREKEQSIKETVKKKKGCLQFMQ